MRKGTEILLFLIIFLFSFIIRLSLISRGPYHYDGLELAICSEKTLDTLRINYMHGPGYPFTVILGSIFVFLFRLLGNDNPVLAVNFMSVVFSSLGVLMLYLIIRRLFNLPVALFSSILFSFSPAFLSVSIYGMNISISIFFVLVALLCMIRFNHDKRVYLVLSGISLGLAAASRLSDALMVLPLSIFYFLEYRKDRYANLKWLLYFVAPLFLIVVTFYIPMFIKIGLSQIISFIKNPQGAQFLGLFSRVMLISFRWILDMLSIPGLIIAIVGGFYLFLNNRRVSLFLILWFLILFLYYANVSTVEPRMLVITIIPLIISMGYFIFFIFQKFKVLSIILLILLTILMFINIYPVLSFRHQNALQVDFAKWVESLTENNAVIIAADEWIFLNYYTDRKTMGYPYTCYIEIIDAYFTNTIEDFLNKGIPVYIIKTAFAYDPCRLFQDKLLNDYKLIFIGEHLNEDWHHKCISSGIFIEELFKIVKK